MITVYDGYQVWAAGFISGAGYAGLNLRETDFGGLVTFMDQYCQAHPLEHISRGAQALVGELQVRH
jgi:hypothetical protein